MSESGLLGVTQQMSELGHESRLSPDKQNEHRLGKLWHGKHPLLASEGEMGNCL